MRAARLVVIVCLLPAALGCPSMPPTGGGGSGSFTLSGPKDPVDVLLGGTASAEVSVVWKSGGKEKVDLTVDVDPRDKGVTATAQPPSLKPDETGKIAIGAKETTPAGSYKVHVT